MRPNPRFPEYLVTSTKEILNAKLHFFLQCISPPERQKIIDDLRSI